VRAPQARGERPGDEELGVGRNGEFCAYPLRMMAFHRVVNDHLGGPPILVTYDSTSSVGRVFDPVLAGKPYAFEAASAEQGLPMLRDRQTGSRWSALTGRCLSGPLKGKEMGLIPSLILTWERWQGLHADSWVLAEQAALSAHYTARVTAATCRLAPAVPAAVLQKVEGPLKPDALVIGLNAGGKQVALSLPTAGEAASARNLKLGRTKLALFSDPAARTVAAYHREVEGRPLRFAVATQEDGAPL